MRVSLKLAATARVSRLFVPMQRVGQEHRRDQFAELDLPPDRVVFLGDSITEFGLWHEWFPEAPVVNRGIGGETTAQILDRVGTAIVSPRAVFLLAGTNDLTLGVPQEQIVSNVQRVLSEIERVAPGTPVTLQSVMPRASYFKEAIESLNRRYRSLAATHPGVVYLNLWPALADQHGELKNEYSLDRLHLNGSGYRAWADVLRPHVNAIMRAPST